MHAIANQFWIVLQALAKLLWLIAKAIFRLVYHLSSWVYVRRHQIAAHKATPWVLASVAVCFSVWQLYRHIQSPSTEELSHTEAQAVSTYPAASPLPAQKEPFSFTKQTVSHKKRSLLSHIHSWMNVPHQDGGKSRKGTDCSGFVQNVYKETYGITLSRSSAQMYEQDVTVISKEELTEGDLVFFDTFGGNTISHVGIYLDNQHFAHASTSRGVTIDSLTNPYYQKHYYGSGRINALESY